MKNTDALLGIGVFMVAEGGFEPAARLQHQFKFAVPAAPFIVLPHNPAPSLLLPPAALGLGSFGNPRSEVFSFVTMKNTDALLGIGVFMVAEGGFEPPTFGL